MQPSSKIQLTVLAENHSCRDDVGAEHGLSFFLEGPGWKTLFDTGQSGLFAENARTLKIDLARTTELVFSHGHYDHTGGLPAFAGLGTSAKLFFHPDCLLPRYSIKDPAEPRGIGIPEASRKALSPFAIESVQQPCRVNQDLSITGPIPRDTDYEDVGGPFFLDPQGRQPDPIIDDQALWFLSRQGLVIILGCAHAGVINTIRHCRRLSGEKRLHAVIGGFHLVNADQQRLDRTIAALQEIKPARLAPCHCTGDPAIRQLQAAFPDNFEPCRTGSVFTFF